MKKTSIIVSILLVLLLAFVSYTQIMGNVQIPQYQVLESHQTIEVREYSPMIIAEVRVSGDRKEAIGNGFRLLVDYIFGKNRVNKTISMTAPVQQEESKKIAMTAPVQQEADGKDWVISFVMPSEYTLETLPEPLNEKVKLTQVPSKRFVVIRFSGTASEKNLTTNENKLKDYIQGANLVPLGVLKYAFYNPPWTLPPLRRNEIMIEIKS